VNGEEESIVQPTLGVTNAEVKSSHSVHYISFYHHIIIVLCILSQDTVKQILYCTVSYQSSRPIV